jgi:hypothetical protein
MSRVHEKKQLTNKPIIEETPESLGLVQVTTCPLSGKLATDACYLDRILSPSQIGIMQTACPQNPAYHIRL